MITESNRLSGALDEAALLWPEAKNDRGALLRKILDTGITAIEEEHKKRTQQRLDAVTQVAGSMPGVWPAHWREDLRDEWPA